MSSCWKCGGPTPAAETECETCANGRPRRHPGNDDFDQSIIDALSRTRLYEIDWAKVHTVEGYRLILADTFSHIAIPEHHPAFALLKRFLK